MKHGREVSHVAVILPRLDDFIVDEIKGALDACKTLHEVTATANHYTPHVKAMQASKSQYYRTMAIQIREMVKYKRICIRSERDT